MEKATEKIVTKSTTRQLLGRAGEDYVANWLEQQGWHINARNWRAAKYAETDIIATDNLGTLVFVEVKTRRNPFGKTLGETNISETGFINAGFEKIDYRKVKKMRLAARLYLSQHVSQHVFQHVSQHRLSQFNVDQPGYRFDAVIVYFLSSAARLDEISNCSPSQGETALRNVEIEVHHVKGIL